LAGSFFPGLALQIAHNNGAAIFVRQATQLIVEQGLQIMPEPLLDYFGFGHVTHLPFPYLPLGSHCSRLQRCLVSHAIQPVTDHLSRHNGSCLAEENKKGGLKSILGIVMVVEDPTANAPHHRTMPPHQGGNRCFFASANKALQKLPISQTRRIVLKHCLAKVLDDLAPLAGRHVLSSCAFLSGVERSSATFLLPAPAILMHAF
jgi:hypothetical protein